MAEENSNPELAPNNEAIPARIVRLLSVLSRSSTICFAIFDQDFRFRAVNQVLAATHGLSIEINIGATSMT